MPVIVDPERATRNAEAGHCADLHATCEAAHVRIVQDHRDHDRSQEITEKTLEHHRRKPGTGRRIVHLNAGFTRPELAKEHLIPERAKEKVHDRRDQDREPIDVCHKVSREYVNWTVQTYETSNTKSSHSLSRPPIACSSVAASGSSTKSTSRKNSRDVTWSALLDRKSVV